MFNNAWLLNHPFKCYTFTQLMVAVTNMMLITMIVMLIVVLVLMVMMNELI